MMHRISTYFRNLSRYAKEYFRTCTDETVPSDRATFFIPNTPLSVDFKYRADIDGLRAIAVAAVILFHVFPTHLSGGFIGVDMFFVISGYLISSIIYKELDEGSFSFITFYSRRVRRIFPSLITVLAACYLVGWHLLLPVEYKKLGAHITAASGFSSNFLLQRESGYFDDASDSKVLLHLWSLGIEEQFYIIWPLLFYVLWKTKLNLLTVTIGLTLSSFILNIVKIQTSKVQTFYYPTTRAWELLIGACLVPKLTYRNSYFENYKRRLVDFFIAIIFRKPVETDGSTLRNVTSTTGALLIVFPMCFLTKASIFPGWWAIAPTMGTALLISVGSTSWINRTILSSRFLVGVGLISYPLYLWHWPLLVYTRIFVGHQTSYYTRVNIVFLSIILAWITHACIEKPFRLGQYLKIKCIILCIIMVGVGSIGYHTYRAQGLPFRLSQAILDITNYEQDKEDTWASYRRFTCFLEIEQDESKFGACTNNTDKPASNGVILWGDSHAAHLYPGIAAAKPVVRVTQLTASTCPPILELQIHNRPHCKRINDYVLRRISQEKPNTVILAALWFLYRWENLTNTVSSLRKASVQNIYLVGCAPAWNNSLPACLYDYYLHDKSHRVPHRMHAYLIPNLDNFDKAMNAFATKINVTYISLYNILCSSDGCLTKIGGNNGTLATYDHHHFSVSASTFVVSHFPTTLLHHLSGISENGSTRVSLEPNGIEPKKS